MTEYAGQGDANRTLGLLWGKVVLPKRGPSQGSSVEEIVAAAVRIADAEGLAGLSMRAVGRELNRTAMSLYTYVPGRAELLALMYDGVHAEVAIPAGKVWRRAAMKWCEELRELYLQHPWLLEISQRRPALGPNEQAVLESLLRILASAGLPVQARPSATSALFSIVRGAAINTIEAHNEQDNEWWAERAKVMHEVAPDFADRFPETAAIATHQSTTGPKPWRQAAERAFKGAVTLVLDGIAQATTKATTKVATKVATT